MKHLINLCNHRAIIMCLAFFGLADIYIKSKQQYIDMSLLTETYILGALSDHLVFCGVSILLIVIGCFGYLKRFKDKSILPPTLLKLSAIILLACVKCSPLPFYCAFFISKPALEAAIQHPTLQHKNIGQFIIHEQRVINKPKTPQQMVFSLSSDGYLGGSGGNNTGLIYSTTPLTADPSVRSIDQHWYWQSNIDAFDTQ
jgi:hypothetical protein